MMLSGMELAYMYSLLLFFVQILILVPSSRAKVPAIIVFGDSTVDTGNNNYIPTIAKGNFQPYGRDFPGGFPTGRFCNGRLPPDFLSEYVGLKPTVPAYLDPAYNISDFATGVCFASAATGYDNATADILQVIPLWKEVENFRDYKKRLSDYLGIEKANEILREAIYIVSIGTNDFIENYYPMQMRRSQFTVKEYQDFLIGIAENFFNQIYHLGARKISLTGLSPMGCLPSERTANFQDPFSCNEEYNNVALEFNRKMKNFVAKLNRELPGIRVVYSEIYDFILEIITKPSKFGKYWSYIQ
ncbi:hypothetical protein Pint_01387 [Pistacia integerrima]|uniref:Uncharacterized protein n=1 Tax=Pistacia integerrima TaxID=434235 RepID=A0ACC0ZQK3_9ROSI|nr:hypothetical protein Pint_01387 [Pistacia integerrima]